MKSDSYFVHILSNACDTVLYVGMTNDLERRVIEHRSGTHDGFTKRYYIHKLIYFETYRTPLDAIHREKEIKGWRREKKIRLIKTINPTFADILRDLLNNEIPHPSASGIRNDAIHL